MFYWCVPRLYGTKLHSRAAANFHFWIGTIGILIYVAAMWAGGIMQGLMLSFVDNAFIQRAKQDVSSEIQEEESCCCCF